MHYRVGRAQPPVLTDTLRHPVSKGLPLKAGRSRRQLYAPQSRGEAFYYLAQGGRRTQLEASQVRYPQVRG